MLEIGGVPDMDRGAQSSCLSGERRWTRLHPDRVTCEFHFHFFFFDLFNSISCYASLSVTFARSVANVLLQLSLFGSLSHNPCSPIVLDTRCGMRPHSSLLSRGSLLSHRIGIHMRSFKMVLDWLTIYIPISIFYLPTPSIKRVHTLIKVSLICFHAYTPSRIMGSMFRIYGVAHSKSLCCCCSCFFFKRSITSLTCHVSCPFLMAGLANTGSQRCIS